MTEFEIKLIEAFTRIGSGLEEVSTSIDHLSRDNDSERAANELGTAIERGLADLATAVNNLDTSR